MNGNIKSTLFSDPTCPWAYSENPALRVLEWRYGEQLEWELVLVGLSEDTKRYEASGYTPARRAQGQVSYRERYGMPFALTPKSRLAASTRACRAVIAARRSWPGSEWSVFRALQLAQFTTSALLDDDDHLLEVLRSVPGIDAELTVSLIDSPEVIAEYEADKARTRTAAGSPTEFQGKAANSDGVPRYTAPSVIFEAADGRRLEAGGFQPIEAYDVLIANLNPSLERHDPPSDMAEVLEYFELGVTTQEVAAIMTSGNDRPDQTAVEAALIGLVGEGRAQRHPLGGDALWTVAGGPQPPRLELEAAVAS